MENIFERLLQSQINIKLARELSGLSQNDFSALYFGTKDKQSSYEVGRAKPSRAAIEICAELLSISSESFVSDVLARRSFDEIEIRRKATIMLSKVRGTPIPASAQKVSENFSALPEVSKMAIRLVELERENSELKEQNKQLINQLATSSTELVEFAVAGNALLKTIQHGLVQHRAVSEKIDEETLRSDQRKVLAEATAEILSSRNRS